MAIDFHAHITPVKVIQNRERYVQSDRMFATIFSNPKEKLATTEDLIREMDKSEVDVSVVLNYGWTTQSLCRETNDYILEAITRYPKRLVGFCSVTSSSDKALKELERCIKGGAKGIGELRIDTQFLQSRWLESFRQMVEFAIENKLIMHVHSSEPVGHPYPAKGTATPDKLYSLITAFPELKLVCAHWGGGLPFYALMPEVKESLKNVYFDTAASPFLYMPQVYKQVAQIIGEDKILFGSDYPLMPPRRYFKEIDTLNFPARTREKIVSGNAKKLLGIAKE
jgi:uncharacterized protein